MLSESTPNPERERLIAALDPSGIDDRHIGKSHAGLILHPRQAESRMRFSQRDTGHKRK